MNLRPWREIAIPHEDVHKGTFQQAEFAADISRVHAGKATGEYQEPALFFQRTFITEGMRELLVSVVRRLAGSGGDPVIQLQTAFGGGKTHTMLAVMHLVSGKAEASQMQGIPDLLDRAGVVELPRAKVVVLDGIRLSPSQPRQVDGHALRTLWGELAWQLGGAEAHAMLAEADASGTSPGKEVLAEIINAHSPCVILIDELVAYIRQFEDGRNLAGGSFDSNLTFIQALTEAMKSTPRAALLASLPESDREAGSQRGVAALRALEHYFGRVQAIWKPVSTEESFEIVRRRLFRDIADRAAADTVVRAFADHYLKHGDTLPSETQDSRYFDRLRRAYPIHPEVFDRLYEDWSALPNFQRTRGVLKLMARVIHRLWQEDNRDLMILPASLPLADRDVHTELTNYLPPGWDPVLDKDVDGERSEPADLETREPKFGALQACRRIARSIFLGSAPSSVNEGARGVETERLILSCLQPGQAPHVYRDALSRLEGRLTFLNKGNNRWWLDVRPNLRRTMEDRKRLFADADIQDAVRDALHRVMGSSPFDATHVFTASNDVPDDWSLRLVILSLANAWSRSGPNPAQEAAEQLLRMRGEQPRQRQNRLLFLAADADQVMHLKDTVRSLLAWRSIEADARDLKLTLDVLQTRQATQFREQTHEAVLRLVREAFRCLLAPHQGLKRDGTVGAVEWEMVPLNPANVGLGKELGRVLAENELVIREWAPVHLANLLRRWFWRDDIKDVPAVEVWQKTCCYLYFPRLSGSMVMQAAIAAGAMSRDFFALAYGKSNDRYDGFMFGARTSPIMDSLLLIEPEYAAEYEARTRPVAPDPKPDIGGVTPEPDKPKPHLPDGPTLPNQSASRRFYGTIELDPVAAGLKFSKVMSELVELFTAQPGCRVRIKVDIEAETATGLNEQTTRAVKENAKVLGFGQFELE